MKTKDVLIAFLAGCAGWAITSGAIVIQEMRLAAVSNRALGLGAVALAVSSLRSISAFVLCAVLALWFRLQRRTRS